MRSQLMRVAGGVALVLVVAGFVAQPSAERHLALVRAQPAVDTVMAIAPGEIRLFYTQAPNLSGTRVRLTASGGAAVELGPVEADRADDKIVSAPVTGTMTAGVHTVTWRALSADGHVVEGAFDFTFRPAH
jgi:methionine-rich copper-binding protein CopC